MIKIGKKDKTPIKALKREAAVPRENKKSFIKQQERSVSKSGRNAGFGYEPILSNKSFSSNASGIFSGYSKKVADSKNRSKFKASRHSFVDTRSICELQPPPTHRIDLKQPV